jgi:hypothetical protein
VPRGAPQCRHVTTVDEGAPCGLSKTMPRPPQTAQIISNPFGRLAGICMADFKAGLPLNRAAKRNMIA